MARNELTAIVFDIFGTVVDWRGSLIAELTTFGHERNLTADWPALVDAWRGAYQPSMERVRRGELPWTTLDHLHRATLNRLVLEFGVHGLTEDELEQINLGWHRLRPWPDVLPGLLRLKRRYMIGPLSNGNVSLLVDMARHAALPWDVIFGADLFEHYKPDPEVYLGACRLLDLPPERVMLVAAHNYDLRGAQAIGLCTGFVPRKAEAGPNQAKDLGAEGDWDVVARDFEDLAAILA